MYAKIEVKSRNGGPFSLSGREAFGLLLSVLGLARGDGAEVVAFCLMTTHVHLVLAVPDEGAPERVAGRLARQLQSRAEEQLSTGGARLDVPGVPQWEVLEGAHAVLRYAAYCHANPVSAEMVLDPAAWPLSSHRDVLGLRAAPWYSARALLALGEQELKKDARSWLHERAKGRFPMPGPVAELPAARWPLYSLDSIAEAVLAWHGALREDLGRKKRGRPLRHDVAAVAWALGWSSPAVAPYLGWTDRHATLVKRGEGMEPGRLLAIVGLLASRHTTPPAGGWTAVPYESRGPRLLDVNL